MVITVISNLGLVLKAKELGIYTVQTNVGDRYVLEEMLDSGYNLGGEASGTEPCVRVMFDGENQDVITQKANYLASIIESRLG